MAENLFNKIKKSFNSFIGISESLEKDDFIDLDKSKPSDNNLLNQAESTDNLSKPEIKSEVLPVEKSLSFNFNEKYIEFLKDFYQADKEIISCIIFDKETLNVKSVYSKDELDKEYIVFLLNNVTNIIANDKINNLIKCEHIDSLIDKILIVRVNDYQYISIIEGTIIVVITNQKNQLIAWKNIDKIKEYVLT